MRGILSDVEMKLTRRGFCAAGAAGMLASSSLIVGCSPNSVEQREDDEELPSVDPEEGAVWMTAPCWHDCGSRCLNRVLVKDGIVLRQGTDNSHEDSMEFPQLRSCPRGHSQRKQVFGEDRLRYPMKRKHWEPLTGGDKSLRGEDEWERISWEEALDYVAAEIKNVKEKYGNRAIYKPDCTGNGDEIAQVLNNYGGFTSCWSPMSFGTWTLTAMRMAGPPSWMPVTSSYTIMGWAGPNDRLDFLNCDYVVMFSSNPAWAAMRVAPATVRAAREAGAKFISVDPFFNDTSIISDAEWIPVRPGTDTAFMLGVAYSMLEQDAEEDLIDWDFIKTYSVGFDAETMPADAKLDENFKDYVMGVYDGTPKTPEWASNICGAPVEQIESLARILGKKNNVALLAGYASSRTNNSDNMPQMLFTLGIMGAHIGRPGNMTGLCAHGPAYNGGGSLVSGGGSGMPSFPNPIDDTIGSFQAWSAVLDGEYDLMSGMRNQTGVYDVRETEHREIDLHMMYHCYGQSMLTNEDLNQAIEAHKKMDFVVTQAYALTTNAKYSDIVLPITTPWERAGSQTGVGREGTYVTQQISEPLFEAQDDQWVAEQLAERLGIDPKVVFPLDRKQQLMNSILGATVTLEDGKTKVPLVTFTEEDLKEQRIEGEPQEGKISLKDYLEAGTYQVPRHIGDNYGHIAFKPFIDDPENMPLTTTSGKFEIYCQVLADTVNSIGLSEIKPYPTYIPAKNGYEEAAASKDKKFQMFSIHYLRRAHTAFENVGWLREAWPAPLFMNAQDAKEKGLKTGDTVLVENEYGSVLRHVSATERMMPGVCAITHGGWSCKNRDGVDVSGPESALTASVSTGQGVSAYNSQIVSISPYSGEPLGNDAEFSVSDGAMNVE